MSNHDVILDDQFCASARGGRHLIVPSRHRQLPHDANHVFLRCVCGCGRVFRDAEGVRVEAIPGKYAPVCAERKLKALALIPLDFNEVRR